MNDIQHEQLFTDLTLEQAAVIEGGLWLDMTKIKCITAGADSTPGNSDDLFITVGPGHAHDDRHVFGTISIDDGLSADINKTVEIRPGDWIGLYDEDVSFDDEIDSYQVFGPEASWTSTFGGNGSTYELTYGIRPY